MTEQRKEMPISVSKEKLLENCEPETLGQVLAEMQIFAEPCDIHWNNSTVVPM